MPTRAIVKVNLALRLADTALVIAALASVAALVPWGTHLGGAVPHAVTIVTVATLLVALMATVYYRRAIGADLAAADRAHAALQDSETRFAGILAIAADAIVTVDDSHRILHFNRGAEVTFGYSAAEMLGQPLDRLLPDQAGPVHRRHIERFARGDESARRMPDRREVAGRHRDGRVFPADISISKLETTQGMIFTAVVRDVTAQKRTEHHEHTLAVAGARLGATLDYDAVLRLIVDIAADALGNCAVLDVTEPSDEAALTLRRIASSHGDPARDQALRSIEQRGLDWDSPSEAIDVFRTGVATLHPQLPPDWLEARATTDEEMADLAALQFTSMLSVPLTARDRVIGVLTVGRSDPPLDEPDLDLARALADRAALAIENALLYRRAQRALAARDEVLAIVSHDLRTPSMAIAMCARTLLDHPPESDAARQELYATILEAAEWTHRLMQDLLDAAAIDAGRLSVDPEPASVATVLATAIDQFAERARGAGLTLRTAIPANLPPVMIDPGRMLQLLGNLLSNALRFTPAAGTITVSAAAAPEGVVITVRDTGAGITGEHLPHLFDRFWHAKQAGVARGTGLGLAIAKGIVEAHRGRIWVESEVGHGSAFSVLVPPA